MTFSWRAERTSGPATPTCRWLFSPAHGLVLTDATDRVKGPVPVLAFLGIELDSVAGCLRLPARKLERLTDELARLMRCLAVSKRDLLSVTDMLHHVATVNLSGRAFLRRLINLSMVPRHMDHYVRLNSEAWADLNWWSSIAREWNGMAFFTTPGLHPLAHRITTHASGS